MSQSVLEQIENAEINVDPYDPDSLPKSTIADRNLIRQSLIEKGLLNPIVVTTDEKGTPLIVDGNLRYRLCKELKEAGKWKHGNLPVKEVTLEVAKQHRSTQTYHKNFTPMQLAIEAVKKYWNECQQQSAQIQKAGKKANADKKGRTSEKVANKSGVNEKYILTAHKLLELDDFFYKFLFIGRNEMKYKEAQELTDLNKNNPAKAKAYVAEMKNLFLAQIGKYTDTNKEKSIYEEAKSIVNSNDTESNEKKIKRVIGNTDEYKKLVKRLTKKWGEKMEQIEWNDITADCTIQTSMELSKDLQEFMKKVAKHMFNVDLNIEYSKELRDSVMQQGVQITEEEYQHEQFEEELEQQQKEGATA